MSKQIFINLPVTDLPASTDFYTKLGFTKNPSFSNESGSCMVWSEEIYVMLLTHDFYRTFIAHKTVADTKATSGVLLCLSMDSKENVDRFADTAKQNGGDYFKLDSGVSPDLMYGLEVQYPDGHTWEPMWMSPRFDPQSAAY